MNALITGGNGFLGSHLTRVLVEEGDHPILLDPATLRGSLTDIRDRFEYVQSSLGSLSFIINVLRK